MKRRLIHPLWTHIPAATLLIGFVVLFLVKLSDWPSRIPLQTIRSVLHRLDHAA